MSNEIAMIADTIKDANEQFQMMDAISRLAATENEYTLTSDGGGQFTANDSDGNTVIIYSEAIHKALVEQISFQMEEAKNQLAELSAKLGQATK